MRVHVHACKHRTCAICVRAVRPTNPHNPYNTVPLTKICQSAQHIRHTEKACTVTQYQPKERESERARARACERESKRESFIRKQCPSNLTRATDTEYVLFYFILRSGRRIMIAVVYIRPSMATT